MKIFQFVGGRVVKTGVSVFLTAWICELLNWPPVFAVITAIVTVEPTVADSIRKGIIRFPASAIGSFYAVLFISLFGNSPLTYTLAAVLTIATCFRLKLYAGLLVATLTSVAMVEVIHSNFVIAFFIRLGTTTVGLLVSTIVNMFILPPDYRNDITEQLKQIAEKTSLLIENLFTTLLDEKREIQHEEKELLKKIEKRINKTEELIRYQEDEAKYHPLVGKEQAEFELAKRQLNRLRMIRDHLDTLMDTPIKNLSWTNEERNLILDAVKKLAHELRYTDSSYVENHEERQRELMELFWEDNEEITKNNEIHPTKFPPELIILYEFISIYRLVGNYLQEDK